MADYNISLGVIVDQASIGRIRNQINKIKLAPVKVNLDTRQIQNQINSIRRQLQDLNNIRINLGGARANANIGGVKNAGGVKAVNDVNKTANQLSAAYTKLKNISRNIGSIKIKLNGLDTSKDTQQIQILESQLKSLTAEYHNTVSKIKGKGDLSPAQWSSLQQQIENTKIKLDQVGAKIADTKAKLATGIQGNFGNYDAQIAALENRFGMLANKTPQVRSGIESVRQALATLKAADGTDELIASNEAYKQVLQQVEAQLKQLELAERGVNNTEKLNAAKEAAMRRLNSLFSDGSAAAKKYGGYAQQLRNELESCGNIQGVQNVTRKINALGTEIKNTHVQTQTFGERLKNQFAKYSSYFSVATVIMISIRALRDMFNQVKAIDTAMTELKKVTNETDASYNKFLSNASKRAKEIGTTIDGLVSSTADFARLGYSFKESQGLAEVANIYAVVGDEVEGVEGATESLISTMAAFKGEMDGMSDSDFAMSIIDKFNEVGNNFAISSGGIGEAMERSASSLYAANNTLDESIALITAANTVVQNPEAVGTAFKTISMRIRGAKTELEEAGLETDGMVESTAKLREEILALSGVDIMEDANTFKSTYQIMDELATKWKDLTDIQQASITELIAGKRQGNIVSSLMANFDVARDALNTSLQSSGSAMKEHGKWSDSLEARLNKLKATWQSFAQSFMDSSLLKGGIEVLKVVLNLLDKLTQNIGSFGTIGLTLGIIGIVKNFGTLKTIFTALIAKTAGAAIGFNALATSASAVVGGIGLLVAGIGLYYNQVKKAKEAAAELRQETISASDEYFKAASSFESAYIKYSGRTDLTAEEESELESAIQGTVDALGDKSSALQNIVNSSNDYIASLEQIANAEKRAANDAAKKKLIAAEENLKESAIGWRKYDGSEVNIGFSSNANEDALAIAKEVGSEFWDESATGRFSKIKVGLKLDANADLNEILEYYYMLIEYQNKLEDAELTDTNEYDNVTAAIGKMSEAIGVYTEGVYEAAKAEYQLQNGIPKTAEEYMAMRESILSSMSDMSFETRKSIAGSMDSEYGQYFDLTSAEIQSRKLIGILDEFGEIEASKVETFLNMRTAVNNNECTIGEYMSQFDKINEMTAGWSEEAIDELNTTFGIDADKIKEQYEDVKKYLKRQVGTDEQREMFYGQRHLSPSNFGLMAEYAEEINESEEKIEKFLDSLSASELQAVINLKTEIDWTATPEEILAQIEKEAELVEAISFTVNLELEAEKLENLNTAISEAVSGAGLGSSSMSLVEDMFGDLDSYDPTKLFERTANGIRMNTDEFRKLNDEYKNNNIEGFDNKLSALAEEYNKTRDELTNLTYGSEEYNEKLRDLDNLESQINATEQLASQYRGLASAYQTWQMAESAGSQRDMYESMLEGLENVDDELSRGWLDDGTIEFLRLIKGENISATATTKELKAAYDSLDDTIKNTSYSVRDFFTVDEDGNSTNDGVYNFLDAIGQLEEEAFGGLDVVQRDGSGNIIGFDFQVAGGDKAIADALVISEELVQIMVRAADDAGFVVSMDGTYQQLDTLKDKAQEAANKLKELGLTTFGFDLNTGNEDSVFSQYEEALKIWEPFTKNKNADGTIDMTVEGAEEAFTLVSTLQSMVDKLSEPTYMKLDATQVEKDMKTPLSKLQEYERLTQQEHQLQLKGTDTSELDKSQEEIIDYFDNLQENSPEIAAELGIKGLTREEIQAKVESGEIEIPATIDLQVEMNQSMRDMVNIALYNAGLLGDKDGEGLEELKKRVDIELYAGEIDDSDVKEKVDETVEGEDGTRQKNIEIIANTFGSEDVDGLKTKLEGLDDKTVEAVANVVGQIDVDKLKGALKDLPSPTVQAIAEVLGKGDVEGLKEELNKLHPMKVQAIAEAFGYESVEELNTAIANMDGNTVQAVAEALGLGDVNGLQAAIDGMHGNTVDANVNTDGQADKVTALQSVIDGLRGKVVNVVVNTIKNFLTGGGSDEGGEDEGGGVVNGTANVNGTAFANGTAYKHGDWGVKKTQTALTGELGQELVVYKNRYWTVGDDGAEFATIPRGAIVFNHKQTEELFKNGKVTSDSGRGKALHSGTAFVYGSRAIGGIGRAGLGEAATKTTTKTKTETETETVSYGGNSKGHDDSGGTGKAGKSSKKSDSGGGGSDSKDEFEEVIDWIETAVARIEREIDRLDQRANNIYKNWSERNSALADEISKVGDEIELQQQAYDEYMDAAADVGLSEEYAEKVRNGTIDIETITDEELKEKVDEYQKWYEKALSCQDAIEDLKETEAELYAQRVENIEKQFDGVLGVIEHEKNMLEEYINQSEAQGWMASYEYYRALSSVEKQNLAELEKKKDAMLEEFNAAMDSGTIEKGSEAYYDMVNAIDEVSLSIAEANTKVMEISQTAQQLKWEQFDLLQDKISAVTEETEFLIELLSNDKLYDDNGQLTSSGMATMGQHGVSYNTHMYQAELAREEAERLQREIARGLYDGTDKYDTEIEERYREMIALQQEHILAAEEEKEAIRDMVEEGIQLELEALSERIDKYNEALDSQKDLYDYQKKVKEQTEEIASLEKQIAAYRGDTSEETRAKIQELKVSLEDAREDLEETEYDKYISDQQEMLDELYLEYETILNTRLDNIDALLSDMIAEVNANASIIGDTVHEAADSVGYTLSDSMQTIWDNSTNNINSVITTYGDKFSSAQTTTNNALNTINVNLQNMISQLNTIAKTKVKSANTSSASKSSSKNTSNAKKTETKKKETKKAGDGTPKIGDKVKFVNGQYYYDSYGMKPLGSQKQGQYVYITNINKRNGATHPYHISTGAKLGNGDLGWLKLSQITGYSTGKYNLLDDEIAWTQEDGREFIVRPSDGAILTPVAKKDSILSANASNNIWNMANSPAEFIRDNLRFNSDNVPNGSAVYSNYTQHLDKVVFNLPNVKNYEELLSAMQKDKNFERLISSMTIDRLAGKSALVKGKSIH